jgi:glycosyltransferase involved in cell wall biosynthesis
MQARRAICQVLAGAESGGLERHFIELCNALSERHQVTAIVHPMHAQALTSRVHLVPMDLAGGRFDPRVLLRLYRAVRRAAPDVVHSHANKATAMLALLKPFLPMSFVATLHNHKSRVWMFRGCDAAIAVSQSLADCLPGQKVTVIPNGIAPPAPVAAARVAAIRDSAVGRPLVLAAGRLVQAKGFDLLLAAWRAVPAPLWIAGEGPQRSRLEALIHDYGLQDRVKLLGQRDDIDALMQAADLLVLPSRREGFPYVLLEALHHRLPVVATRVPGAVDVLPQAWLVPVENAAALVAAVNRARSDPGRLLADFATVWQRAQEELSLATMVQRTEAVYRRVLHG